LLIVRSGNNIRNTAIELKQKNKVKLPEAVIAATSICNNLTLLTADKGFAKINGLDIILLEI